MKLLSFVVSFFYHFLVLACATKAEAGILDVTVCNICAHMLYVLIYEGIKS